MWQSALKVMWHVFMHICRSVDAVAGLAGGVVGVSERVTAPSSHAAFLRCVAVFSLQIATNLKLKWSLNFILSAVNSHTSLHMLCHCACAAVSLELSARVAEVKYKT